MDAMPPALDAPPRPDDRVVDLRGSGPLARTAPVLADPSGRRARRLRAAGRAVGVLFLLWLCGLLLAGVGLIPATSLPLGPALRPAQAPPPLARAVRPHRVAAADLQPARPLVAVVPHAALAARHAAAHTAVPRGAARRGTARHQAATPVRGTPKQTVTVVSGTTVTTVPVAATSPATPTMKATPSRGSSSAAPGRTSSSPGQTRKTTTSTTPAAAPTTTTPAGTTTTPGNSSSAPGHAPDKAHGHGAAG